MRLIGHKTQWQFLKNSVKLGKLPHAFLFSGPNKIGKRTFALELAKLLNCQNPHFEKRPCQNCSVCRSIEKLQFPDLIFISPPKKEISIEQIRALIWKMSLKPYFGPWKVAILDEAHFLNKDSQNCLLKTLEEPKEKSILILITEYPARLLPTILSRTQKIRFSCLAISEIKNLLEEKKLSTETIQRVLQFSEGRPGLVFDFLQDPSKLNDYERKISELEKLLQADLNFRFQYVKKLSEKSLEEINQIFQVCLQYFRKFILQFSSAGEVIQRPDLRFSANPVRKDRRALNPGLSKNKEFLLYSSLPQGTRLSSGVKELKRILEATEKIQILLNFTNINTKLALENLMLQL